MAQQIRDLICKDRKCNATLDDIVSEWNDYPVCPRCAGGMTYRPTKVHTDVFGVAQYSDASGEYHSSTREKEHAMAEWGYYPAGDKVGGARNEHVMKHTAFSYGNQGGRTSTGER